MSPSDEAVFFLWKPAMRHYCGKLTLPFLLPHLGKMEKCCFFFSPVYPEDEPGTLCSFKQYKQGEKKCSIKGFTMPQCPGVRALYTEWNFAYFCFKEKKPSTSCSVHRGHVLIILQMERCLF